MREGSDEPERFSGWLDLLRLLEEAAQVTEGLQRTLAQADVGGNDVDAAGGQAHGFVPPNEPRGSPRQPLTRQAAPRTHTDPFTGSHISEDR
jgi:hypothetical protein